MTAPDLLGGRYELRGVLGRGGMAEVRDGWDTRLHRAVAIKLLHPGLIAHADIRMRFAAEARSAAALSHPNVVAVPFLTLAVDSPLPTSRQNRRGARARCPH